jgi:hypothetical protein
MTAEDSCTEYLLKNSAGQTKIEEYLASAECDGQDSCQLTHLTQYIDSWYT